jgi:colicin import membrane protein
MSAAAIAAYPDPGRIESAVLAALVHLVLFALLFFGVQWQSNRPEAVTVELWDLPPVVAEIPPLPAPPAEPLPVKAEEPKPVPKAEPKPDIALKEKLEKKKQEELKAREEQQKQDEAKRRTAEREKSLREQREGLRKEAESLQAQREAANEQARLDAARATARARAINDYVGRIRSKIRSNIAVPDGIAGNPEAVFDVVQLPGGDILSVKLRKTSGHAAYDAAVERAILKSSPLPKPGEPGLYQRELELKFRPHESH